MYFKHYVQRRNLFDTQLVTMFSSLLSYSSFEIGISLIALHHDLRNTRLSSAMSALEYVPRRATLGLKGSKLWRFSG